MSSDASVGFGREHAPLGASASGDGLLSKPGEFPATIDSPVEAVSCPNPTVIGARPPEGSASVEAHQSRSVAGERAVSNALTGFELLSELGPGGMGVVYKARQVGLNRLVALKMILAGSHAGEEEMLRFHGEAAAVAKLQHANIVQIYEFGEHDGRPYFAFEFVDGGSLAQKLSGTPMPASAAASLAETLARAMQYAHERGIIHRDLKPANVLLQKVTGRRLRVEGTSGASRRTSAERTDTSDARGAAEGEQPRSTVASTPSSSTLDSDPPTFNPKITDFGLAKQLDMDTVQTQSGVIMGTPSYMAPEQAAGLSKDIGPAADIYSLGAILYEMLTGRPPFRAAVVLATLEQVRLQEPVAPSRLQPGLPRDLETICLKCLQKESAKRYESAAMLADDLARFLGGEPIDARPVSRAERAWRWAKRKPALATMTAAVSVLLLAAILGPSIMLVYLNAARKESDDNARKATKNQKTAEANAITANTQRQEAVKQEGIAKAQEKLATAEKARAERLAAGLAVDRGLTLCEQNDVGAGMLWLARGLELSPADAMDMQQFIRTSLSRWEDKLISLRVVLDQGQSVRAVAWSPDGKHLVTGGWDKTAQIWNAATGERAAPPLAHTGTVRAVAFSPDGTKILTGSNDHTARLWHSRSGEPIGPVLRHRDWVIAAVFRPDGKVVATGSNDLTVRLWDTASGEPLGDVLTFLKDIGTLAFSPDSKLLATVTSTNGVQLSDATIGRRIGPALELGSRVGAVQFTPDSKVLATGTAEGVIRCWDVATQQPVGMPMKHDNFLIRRIAFSPDGLTMATAGDGISVRLWNVAASSQFGYPLLHHRSVTSLAFCSDGRLLVSASEDRTARLWDITTGQPIGSLLQHPRELFAMALAPDGRTIATAGSEGTTRLWNLPQDYVTAFTHAESVRSVAVSQDGSMIATGSYDKSVRLWDAATREPFGEPLVHPANVTCVALSPDARLVATGCADKLARIWNLETGELIGSLMVHAGKVFAV